MMLTAPPRTAGTARRAPRRSFTLTELLLTTALITVLASTTLFALWAVIEQAKVARTRAQVVKIHELLSEPWESYRTRKVPILIPPAAPPPLRGQVRLLAIRELMRMELPDRITDVQTTPSPITVTGSPLVLPPPALWRTYRRRAGYGRGLPAQTTWPAATPLPATSSWSTSHQGSECLYLILAAMRDGDSNGLDFFRDSELGDTDGDGMLEILDGWGRPIEFLRWAPGFATRPGPDGLWGVALTDDDGDGTNDNYSEVGWTGSDDDSELQIRDAKESPDYFDALRVDPRWQNGSTPEDDPFMLFPLVFSAGPDGIYDVTSDDGSSAINYAFTRHPITGATFFRNDPYVRLSGSAQIGKPVDTGADGEINAQDNITNHLLEAQ